MPRGILAIGVLALGSVICSIATAQNSTIWCDVRANDDLGPPTYPKWNINTITGNLGSNNPYLNGSVNGGRRGAGQVLYLEPKHQDHWEQGPGFPDLDTDSDRSTGEIWVYMDVEDDPGMTDEVVAAVGMDISIQAASTFSRNRIQDISFELFNDGSVLNSLDPPATAVWHGAAHGELVPGDPPSWRKIKAIQIPFGVAGIVPRDPATNPPYRLGRLRVEAGTRNCTVDIQHAARSKFNLHLTPNGLFIGRMDQSLNAVVDHIAFGYDASGLPETPRIDGDNVGTFSTLPDAVIEVRLKGDFTGDGRVTTADNGGFSTAFNGGQDNVFQAYCGDFSGDNRVTVEDVDAYFQAMVRSASCP